MGYHLTEVYGNSSAQPEFPDHQEALKQIAAVATDNSGPTCNHKMAINFIRQIVLRSDLDD